MQGGLEHETYAAAWITRRGTRVGARALAEDQLKPIPSSQMNVMLKRS